MNKRRIAFFGIGSVNHVSSCWDVELTANGKGAEQTERLRVILRDAWDQQDQREAFCALFCAFLNKQFDENGCLYTYTLEGGVQVRNVEPGYEREVVAELLAR